MPHLRHIAMPLLVLGVVLPGAAAIAETPAEAVITPSANAPAAKALPRVKARVLRPGAAGADVRGMQQLLRAAGVEVDDRRPATATRPHAPSSASRSPRALRPAASPGRRP